MGGATSGPSWDQQRRQYCGGEANVTNPANGRSKLLYIGDSFCASRSAGSIDIIIDAFIEIYERSPNNNHQLVMNPVHWYLTGNVNKAYLADGSTIGGDSPDAPTTTPAGSSHQIPYKPAPGWGGKLAIIDQYVDLMAKLEVINFDTAGTFKASFLEPASTKYFAPVTTPEIIFFNKGEEEFVKDPLIKINRAGSDLKALLLSHLDG
ncbi:MAG: hypothetical protein Q9182_005731 [Xanthomendoza sp. 2 TL-2023]